MTLVAIGAVVHISTDFGVIEIRRVSAPVTVGALEHRVIVRVCVAGSTNTIRVAVVHVEVRVIERRASPGCSRMTRVASCREASRLMVRIGRAVVILLVAAHAGRRQCRVVVVDVAHDASDRCGRVETGQGKGCIVMIERRPRPVRRAVALLASLREA